jgi:biopolymer transport protein ExbD
MTFGSFHEQGAQPMAEINTSPLVDVMLVLLVIFIVTAPLFRQALPVDLPNAQAERLDAPAVALRLTLAAGGCCCGHGRAFRRVGRPRSGTAPVCRPRCPLRTGGATLAAARQAGIVHIAFVTEPKG